MQAKYLQEFLPDLEEFRTKTMKFHNGEMTIPEYKGFSGGYGSYAQRGGKKHMLRLRMAGGRLTKERLTFVCNAIREYGIDTVKLDAMMISTYLQMIDRIKMHKYPVNKSQAYDLYARMLNRACRNIRYGAN